MSIFAGTVVAAPRAVGIPTNLVVLPLTTTSVMVNFNNADYYDYHEVRHSPAGAGTWTTIQLASGASITGLTISTSYDVQVRGVNSLGPGSFTGTVTASTKGTPTTISDLSATQQNSSIIVLDYTPATDADYYEERHRLTTGPGAWSTAATLVSDQITGLTESTQYDIEIRGVNDGATGNYSNTASATTDAAAIGNITNLVASTGDTNTLTVTFTNASGAASHEYRWSPCIPRKVSGVASNLSTGLWSAPTTLSGGQFDVPLSGHEYDVQVRGRNGATLGEWSNIDRATTNAAGSNVSGAANVTPSGNAYIDGMIYGGVSQANRGKWTFSGSPQVIDYSFPQAASNYLADTSGYPAGTEPSQGFVAFNESQANAVRRMLFYYQLSINVTFEEITETDSTHATLRFAYSSWPSTAWAYYPKSASINSIGGDSWFDTTNGWYNSPQEGNYGYLAMIHETGHALGLKHPHEAYVSFAAMPTDKDALEYEVMSYRSYVGGSAGTYVVEGGGYPQSPMMYDIAALQYMYGERNDIGTDDTTYTFNASTGQMSVNGTAWPAPVWNRILRTIWDGAGDDTIDLTTGGYVNGDATISTTAGAGSTIKAAQKSLMGAGPHYATYNIYNPIDTSSTIENSSLP